MDQPSRPQSEAHAPLVKLARRGDRWACEVLIERYQARVARFVMAATRDAASCEDLCQTIFVKMVLALPRLKTVERFEPWVFRIALNVCRDHLRSRRGQHALFVAYAAEHDGFASPESGAEDEADRLQRMIARLPKEQRELLCLSLEKERSYGELATLANITIPALKSRLWRARRALRALLFAENPE